MVGHRSAPPDGAESLCTRQHRFMLLGMLPVFFLLFFFGGDFACHCVRMGNAARLKRGLGQIQACFFKSHPHKKKEAKNNWHVV